MQFNTSKGYINNVMYDEVYIHTDLLDVCSLHLSKHDVGALNSAIIVLLHSYPYLQTKSASLATGIIRMPALYRFAITGTHSGHVMTVKYLGCNSLVVFKWLNVIRSMILGIMGIGGADEVYY
jgi:hypothetical protein